MGRAIGAAGAASGVALARRMPAPLLLEPLWRCQRRGDARLRRDQGRRGAALCAGGAVPASVPAGAGQCLCGVLSITPPPAHCRRPTMSSIPRSLAAARRWSPPPW